MNLEWIYKFDEIKSRIKNKNKNKNIVSVLSLTLLATYLPSLHIFSFQTTKEQTHIVSSLIR
jgi:hypothetical protein